MFRQLPVQRAVTKTFAYNKWPKRELLLLLLQLLIYEMDEA
jgi:hypothetical protein